MGSKLAIRLSQLVNTRITRRGTSEQEIADVIARGLPDSATRNREAKSLVYPFGRRWGTKSYEQKKVRVIYVEEGDDILVINLYVYYGSWQ
ncbi:MAG: hypothetical protein AB7N24_04035 [Dehalococcoidia bacterium]